MVRLVVRDGSIDLSDTPADFSEVAIASDSDGIELTPDVGEIGSFFGAETSASLTFSGRNVDEIEVDSANADEQFVTDFPSDARGRRLDIEVDSGEVRVTGLGRVFNDDLEDTIDEDEDSVDGFLSELFELNDSFRGGDDDDTLLGFDGNDTMRGGSGNDLLYGGIISTGSGDDGNDRLFGQDGNDRLDGGRGENRLFGGNDDDLLTVDSDSGNDNRDVMNGQNGNDYILGQFGDDALRGGSGQDRIEGGEGDDRIRGNAGDDGAATTNIIGGSGADDLFEVSAGLFGGDGNDRIWGNRGEDFLDGGSGDDILRGGADDDIIDGGQGEDTIRGGGGEDVIQGELGDDDLNGRAGDDTFVYTTSDIAVGGDNDDTIRGFRAERDQIDISSFGFESLTDTTTGFTLEFDDGPNARSTEITISDGDATTNDITITILGRRQDVIEDADNFIFAPASD